MRCVAAPATTGGGGFLATCGDDIVRFTEETGRNLSLMNGIESPTVFWLLVALQFFGVSCGCAVRLSEGSPLQGIGQGVFFTALALMGTATVAALAVGPGVWLACSAALAVMVLTVTCDFRGSCIYPAG